MHEIKHAFKTVKTELPQDGGFLVLFGTLKKENKNHKKVTFKKCPMHFLGVISWDILNFK